MSDWFVSTEWLAANLDNPDVIVIDASWHLPSAKRDAHAEYLAGHIPGAVFFDIDGIADTETDLPHMLPRPEDFARMVGALGISDDKTLVVYDEIGFFTAPRAWWELTTMGARDVRVLLGGGPKWRAENRPLEAGETHRAPATFTVDFHAGRVVDFSKVKAHSQAHDVQIADARAAARFAGTEPEPRPGLRSGHIPGARNVPVSSLSSGGMLKSPDQLRALFAEAGVDLERPIITSCGSGVTACALSLALQSAGAKSVAVYDGSWAEWGARPDAEVEQG